MGCTWEVEAWVDLGQGYDWSIQYAGESLFAAVKAMRRGRRNGCTRLTWRPT